MCRIFLALVLQIQFLAPVAASWIWAEPGSGRIVIPRSQVTISLPWRHPCRDSRGCAALCSPSFHPAPKHHPGTESHQGPSQLEAATSQLILPSTGFCDESQSVPGDTQPCVCHCTGGSKHSTQARQGRSKGCKDIQGSLPASGATTALGTLRIQKSVLA